MGRLRQSETNLLMTDKFMTDLISKPERESQGKKVKKLIKWEEIMGTERPVAYRPYLLVIRKERPHQMAEKIYFKKNQEGIKISL